MGSVVAIHPVPTTENRTVAPSRTGKRHADVRTREYLTPEEVDKLVAAAKHNRHGQRDSLMVLMAYRHGLRAKELVELEWPQVDFTGAWLHVNRAKNGLESNHPLKGDELRALRALRRDHPHATHVFITVQRGWLSEDGRAAR